MNTAKSNNQPSAVNQPLKDLLVVALEQAAAAPYVSCRLADAGARVIKIEKAQGDFARGYDGAVNGQSTYFVWLNRGKESIVLDFNCPADAALLHRLIGKADVLIQNLGPGAAKRAGFGWEAMRKAHPRLITCDISGYGEEGPYRDMRAYDLLVQAESGLASVTGTPQAPGRIGISACDIGTGMYAHAAILEALLLRERSGEGSAIHVSLFDSMCDWMTVPLLHYDYAGTIWPRVGLSHPTIAPYGEFTTGDGKTTLIGIQNDEEWSRFAREVICRPDLAERVDFKTNVSRVRHQAEVNAEISCELSKLDSQTLRERMGRFKIAFANVNGVNGLSAHPHLRRAPVQTEKGEIRLVAAPAKFMGTERAFGPVPSLGEHSEAIRTEFA